MNYTDVLFYAVIIIGGLTICGIMFKKMSDRSHSTENT